MAENSVSDVDPDDLAEMMRGIDDLDDDLFGKKKEPAKEMANDLPMKSVLKTSQEGTQGNGRKVQFSPTTESDWDVSDKKDEADNQKAPTTERVVKENLPRKKVEIDFNDDDDILGGLESKTKPLGESKPKPCASFMEDIFGKATDKKSSFLDDIMSGTNKDPRPNEATNKSEFTLDPKYKQASTDKGGLDLGDGSQPRRRRGNPTVGGPKLQETELLAPAAASEKPPENTNPFPWMAEKPLPNPDNTQYQNESTRLPQNITQATLGNVDNQNESLQPLVKPTISTIQFTPTLPHPHPGPTLVNQQLQPQQNHVLDQQHQQVFDQDMETYKRLMSERKLVHTAAIERQRQQLAAQMQELQLQQNQVIILLCMVEEFIIAGDPVAGGARPARAAEAAGGDGRRDGHAAAATLQPAADVYTNPTGHSRLSDGHDRDAGDPQNGPWC
jgi:hypothetical protein